MTSIWHLFWEIRGSREIKSVVLALNKEHLEKEMPSGFPNQIRDLLKLV